MFKTKLLENVVDFHKLIQKHLNEHLQNISTSSRKTNTKLTKVKHSYISSKTKGSKVREEDIDIITAKRADIMLSSLHVKLSSDALCFLVNIEGVQKNLLLFLLFYYLKKEEQTFAWNEKVKDDFLCFCKQYMIKEPTINTIDEAIKSLVSKRVVLAVANTKSVYQLNPLMLYEPKSETKRKQLFSFSNNALDKGKVVEEVLFPQPSCFR